LARRRELELRAGGGHIGTIRVTRAGCNRLAP
jgi:hypothetical protein